MQNCHTEPPLYVVDSFIIAVVTHTMGTVSQELEVEAVKDGLVINKGKGSVERRVHLFTDFWSVFY